MKSVVLLLALAACSPRPKSAPPTGDTTATVVTPDTVVDYDSAAVIDTGAVYDTAPEARPFVKTSSQGATASQFTVPSTTSATDSVVDTVTTAASDTIRRIIGRTTTVALAVVKEDTIGRLTPVATGRPVGAFGMWEAQVMVGPVPPMTLTIVTPNPAAVCSYISTARAKRTKLVLFFGGGSHADLKSSGKFDYAKWRSRLSSFNTSTNRSCVAAGVADGTVIGGPVLDEPEIADWGGVLTKPMLDAMAGFQKGIFPTLPAGVNHGMQGWNWRNTERYRVMDYANYQFNWNATRPGGDLAAWRTRVLNQAALDGVRPAFSLNVINGGQPSSTCPGSRVGTRVGQCNMTPAQFESWGKTQLQGGCALLFWSYDLYQQPFFTLSANLTALRNIAAAAAVTPALSCRRP